MKLIVITTEKILKGEAEALNTLFAEGLETLHLRKPLASKDEVDGLICGIHNMYYNRIVLHEYFSLVSDYGLKGIHLNRRFPELPEEKVSSISRSCHSLEEVEESNFFNYVFLSPIFDSISKAGYLHAFTPQILMNAKKKGIVNQRVIALGGIDRETIPVAENYGFGGVAALGALWSDWATDQNTVHLLKRFKELKTICEQQ